MTTIHTVGKPIKARTEWNVRENIRTGGYDMGDNEDDEREARERLATYRALNNPHVVSYDLVYRTVTEYASGYRLIGPWEVTE